MSLPTANLANCFAVATRQFFLSFNVDWKGVKNNWNSYSRVSDPGDLTEPTDVGVLELHYEEEQWFYSSIIYLFI